MLNQTSNKAVYGVIALSVSLLLGSSLSSKNPGIVARTLGFCASGSAALRIKDKKLLEQQKQASDRYTKIQKYLDRQFNELESQLEQVREAVKDDENCLEELKQKFAKSQKVLNIERGAIQRNKNKLVELAKAHEDNSDKLNDLRKNNLTKPRTPRAKPQQKKSKSALKLARLPKTVVFIDQSNFYHSCENLGIKPDYGSLLCMLTPERGSCEIRVYSGVSNPPSQKQQDLSQKLRGLGYRVIELPIDVRQDRSKKVMSDDIRLAINLQEMVLNGEITDRDRVVLVSSDGDFLSTAFDHMERVMGLPLFLLDSDKNIWFLSHFWNDLINLAEQ